MIWHEHSISVDTLLPDIKLPIVTVCGYLGFNEKGNNLAFLSSKYPNETIDQVLADEMESHYISDGFINSARMIVNGLGMFDVGFEKIFADITYHGNCFKFDMDKGWIF